uniref:Uncharacterized protein n=1 Tax=Cacopsylla melanoneura TaxID=428564 RepID=A0A8D8V0U1_9HEMI
MIYLCRVVPVVLFLSNEHVLVVGVFRIIEGMNETVQGWVWGGRVLGGLLFIHLFKEVYIFGFVWPIKMLSGHCPVRVRVFHLFPVVVCIVSMFPNFRLSYAVGALFRGVGRLCSDEIVGVIDSVQSVRCLYLSLLDQQLSSLVLFFLQLCFYFFHLILMLLHFLHQLRLLLLELFFTAR